MRQHSERRRVGRVGSMGESAAADTGGGGIVVVVVASSSSVEERVRRSKGMML